MPDTANSHSPNITLVVTILVLASASAMLSGLEQTMAGLSGVAVSLLHDGTARPMAIVTIFLTVLLLVVVWWIKRQSSAVVRTV